MSFNFQGLANALALVSLSMAGVVMAGGLLFPEASSRYKRMIPDIFIGLILTASAAYVIGQFGG